MLAPIRVALNEAPCPVDEGALKQLNSQSPKNALAVAQNLPLEERARLCHFCYSRAHMHTLALRIASTCDLQTLVREFGPVGKIVFEQSRDMDATLAQLKRIDRDSEKKRSLWHRLAFHNSRGQDFGVAFIRPIKGYS